MVLKAIVILALFAVVLYAAILSPITRKAIGWMTKPFSETGRFPFFSGLAFSALVPLSYIALIFNRTFPLTEGWYTVYAHYILSGHEPYRDFELLFTPGYSYIIAGLVGIFGSNIIVLRIFGALLFLLLSVTLYLIFSRIFPYWISSIAAVAGVLYLQSEAAQVFYDYIRIYDLFNFLTCLFLLISFGRSLTESDLTDQRGGSRRSMLFTLFAGITVGLAIQIRQNSGYLVLAYGVVLLLFFAIMNRPRRKLFLHIPVFLGGNLIPFALVFTLLSVNGMFDAYIKMTTTDALSSKGGLAVVLFAWIPRTAEQIMKEWISVSGLLVLFLVSILLWLKLGKGKKIPRRQENTWLLLYSVLSVGMIAVMFRKQSISDLIKRYFRDILSPYSLFAIGLLLFISLFILLLLRYRKMDAGKKKFCFLLFAITGQYIATAYGSATSGGLSEGQSAMIMALVIALLLTFTNHKFRREATAVVLALALCVSMCAVAKKYEEPYSWWGLAEPEIRTATISADLPLMQGIYVSPRTKTALDTVYHDITTNSKTGDPIFIFPHIPIFYVMTDRYPDTFTLVQWFDVSSEKDIRTDTEYLRQNPPKVLVICNIPDNAVLNHEKLFRDGKVSAQHEMMDDLHILAIDKNYTLVDTVDLGAEYTISIYVLPA